MRKMNEQVNEWTEEETEGVREKRRCIAAAVAGGCGKIMCETNIWNALWNRQTFRTARSYLYGGEVGESENGPNEMVAKIIL